MTDEAPRRSFVASVTEKTWLLPLATATFILFVLVTVWLLTTRAATLWLIPLFLLPSFVLTWLALIVALSDTLQRPSTAFPGGRTVWVVAIALFNVLAFLPYWALVARRRWSEQAEGTVVRQSGTDRGSAGFHERSADRSAIGTTD